MKKRILGIILILIGVFFIVLHFSTGSILKSKSSVDSLEKMSAEQMQENSKKEVVNQYEAIENLEPIDVILNLKEINLDNVVGQLVIPELDINLPILNGVTNENLMYGVATMKNGQEMGKRNYALAGHNYLEKNVLLNRIYGAEDKSFDIYITDKENTYHYVTVERTVTDEYAFNMIEDNKADEYGSPIISIMTCDRPAEENRRIFLIGKLVDVEPYEGGIKLSND